MLQGTSCKRTFSWHILTPTASSRGRRDREHRFLTSTPIRRSERTGHTGPRPLDRDDRPGTGGQPRQAPAPVHAAGDARLQRHPLASRDGWNLWSSNSRKALEHSMLRSSGQPPTRSHLSRAYCTRGASATSDAILGSPTLFSLDHRPRAGSWGVPASVCNAIAFRCHLG